MTKNHFDAVVIGGGAIGTSVAYHLTMRGLSVALVDKGDIANGSSSRCDAAALICDKKPGIDTRMGYESILLFKKYAEEFSYPFDFTQRGSIYICESEQEMEVAKRYCEIQRADGYDMQPLDRQEICDMEPYLAKDVAGGVLSVPDSMLSPYKLCFAFTEEAKKYGMKVFTYSEVKGIKLDEKGAVQSVVTDQAELVTNTVVNCGGVWAPYIGDLVGLKIPIVPRKGMILISEKTPRIINRKMNEFGLMVSIFGDLNYKRNAGERVEKNNVAFGIEYSEANNLLIGGNRAFKGYDIKSEIEVMQAIAERAVRFFPILRDINCIRTYCGIRPFVEDHLPIVSAVDQIPGYYIAAGHEGNGISVAPITGKLMTQIILGENTDFDIENLRYSRFDQAASA